MRSTTELDPQAIAKEILARVDLELVSCTELQTLWAGYGHVCAVRARHPEGSQGILCLILKIVSPPSGGPQDEGHLRKVLSYEAEQFFYDKIAPTLKNVPLAGCLATTSSNVPEKTLPSGRGATKVQATLMTDLRLQYPVAGEKRGFLTSLQVHSALRWLAEFHKSYWTTAGPQLDRSSLILPPLAEAKLRASEKDLAREGIWLNGGYTYLATRRREYNSLKSDGNLEWSSLLCQPIPPFPTSIAESAASFLKPRGRSVETYLHGDVKSENMCSTDKGDEVAFFDFQYVGLGLGVCDLAKLFTCSVPLEMLADGEQVSVSGQLTMGEGERALLNEYRKHSLFKGTGDLAPPIYSWDDFKRHWETALVDWCRFQASWGFWGNTEWLQARVRSISHDEEWKNWLGSETN